MHDRRQAVRDQDHDLVVERRNVADGFVYFFFGNGVER
jgi:hypothetical protein